MIKLLKTKEVFNVCIAIKCLKTTCFLLFTISKNPFIE